MNEIPLLGGNINPVVRVGDTVRRQVGPWSATIHDLLHNLDERGFGGAPKFLGIDEQNREIVTYIEGEAGFMPHIWSDRSLMEAARLLRSYHDATVDYVPPQGAKWQFIYPDSRRHEVICHNDFAPYNVVFRDEVPIAIIDFDTAGPGPRIWDIAYAVYRFVPLSYADDMPEIAKLDIKSQARRLTLFCDAYGLEKRDDLLANVERRLRALCNVLARGARAGDAAYVRMVEDGHLAFYQRELAALHQHRAELEQLV